MYVVGVDCGTEGARAFVFATSDGRALASHSAPYATAFPAPGRAEQHPADWWAALGAATRGALAAASAADPAFRPSSSVAALCVATTCCTVCALDAAGEAVRPALLWCDVRAAAEAEAVLRTRDPALLVNAGGAGPVSAENLVPKALWLSEHEPRSYAAAATICDFQDFLTLRLTGERVASTATAAVRWHWQRGGTAPPASLLAALGLGGLAAKLPPAAVPPGTPLGRGLTPAAAAHTGLPAGLTVAQGGPDAFVGMLGLGVLLPGQVALLTGSSHLHLAVVAPRHMAGAASGGGAAAGGCHGPGAWGPYPGEALSLPLPGCGVLEGGQTSTGSAAAWLRRALSGAPPGAPESHLLPYSVLDAEAALVPPGCAGLVCLDHFQGCRTPATDPGSRGAFVGLSLAHTRAHLWRALLEGVALGTRAVLDAMARRGCEIKSLTVAGGAARSPLWLQIHADVTGLPLATTACGDAPALGAAVLAAAAAGAHGGAGGVGACAAAMVRGGATVAPDAGRHAAYGPVYEAYLRLQPATAPIAKDLARALAGAGAAAAGGGEEAAGA